MKPLRRRRLWAVGAVICGVAAATVLLLFALRENINLFYTPTEVNHGKAPHAVTIRVGGVVLKNSVRRAPNDLKTRFVISDTVEQLAITYTGILPDLFREGQGVIVLGSMGTQGVFVATQVLAKHDENYTPREIKAVVERAHQLEHLEGKPHDS